MKFLEAEFHIISKRSVIGFVIKLLVFLLFLNFLLTWLYLNAKLKAIVFLVLLIGYLFYTLYNLLKEKTIVIIQKEILKIFYSKGFPIRNYQFEFDLQTVEKIVLKQTHDFLYGTKIISVLYKDSKEEDIVVNLRYYQLVQLQNYLQEHCSIKVSLIG